MFPFGRNAAQTICIGRRGAQDQPIAGFGAGDFWLMPPPRADGHQSARYAHGAPVNSGLGAITVLIGYQSVPADEVEVFAVGD